jgi:lipopolysaccharide/colanic/teichoic acid biosynthesis glycosyltransferase
VRVLKRLVDVIGSCIGLAVTLSISPLIAVAIYVESPGNVLIRQRRAGQLKAPEPSPTGGAARPRFQEFEMLKFRSMRPDAEKNTGPVLASKDDPRITKVGKVLRRTRLDELPQFWNVLRGHMSLVGPRPERPELAEQLAMAIPYFEERMRDVKPGITGLAQISLGYTGKPAPNSIRAELEKGLTNPFKMEGTDDAIADDMRMKLLYDLAYTAATDSLRTYLPVELGIILRTPLVMLRANGT